MRQDKFKNNDFFKQKIARCNKAHHRFTEAIKDARDERHKGRMQSTLYDYSQRLVFISYTMGDPIEQVRQYAEQLIDDVILYCTETNSDLFVNAQGLEWYINCLWYLSVLVNYFRTLF